MTLFRKTIAVMTVLPLAITVAMLYVWHCNDYPQRPSLEHTVDEADFHTDLKLVARALQVVNAPKLINDMEEPRPLAKFILEPDLTGEGSVEVRWTAVNFLKSSAGNVDRRKAIRETWGSVKHYDGARVLTVFILGIPDNESLQVAVQKEHKTFGDILLVNMEESAEHVPDKTLAGMQWASSTLPGEWMYSSGDDDIVLHVPNFVRYIDSLITKRLEAYPFEQNITEKLPIICIYSYIKNDPPARNAKSKWYMPKDRYPLEFWPPYCRGGWYTIPISTVSKLHKISRLMPHLHLDDVWITGLMRIKLLVSSKFLPDNDIRDAMIVHAELASRNDNELFTKKGEDDLSKVIVSHLWGNIEGLKVDVLEEFRKKWKLWSESFNSRI